MTGEAVSRFRVLETLDVRGKGVVYQAEETTLERLVTLKFLRDEFSGGPQLTPIHLG